MGSAAYYPAPHVAELATGLIAEHHSDLISAPIVYVFRSPASRARNRIVAGRALRVTGLRAFLVALAAGELPDDEAELMAMDHTFYVMEIALDIWDQMAHAHRLALVDHELCHFRIDPDNGELKIQAHDVEEFVAVAARHGAWTPDIAAFVESCATPA
jgi:hypothetical protein